MECTDGRLAADLELLIRLGVASLLGGLIGLEREIAGEPARLRTHMLVAASAALFLGLGEILMGRYDGGAASGIRPDPVRIMQAVILGVSFLGAGTILVDRHGGRIEGLTTAAGILLTTGIGMAVRERRGAANIGFEGVAMLVSYGAALLLLAAG